MFNKINGKNLKYFSCFDKKWVSLKEVRNIQEKFKISNIGNY